MCTYLNKTGSTYYFRRPVPDDLRGHFLTDTGKPRTEWKFSLRTKDRETAKRFLRPHEIETDRLIDDARDEIAKADASKFGKSAALDREQAVDGQVVSEREQEEREAQEALLAESKERRLARRDLRKLWRQHVTTSTAVLEPEQAAAVDLIKERDAEIDELRRAISVMQAANDKLGIPRVGTGAADGMVAGQALSISGLFERYALSGTAKPSTVQKWRSRVRSLIEHLGHEDARIVTRADMNGWTAALAANGLAKKTIVDGYLPAVSAAFAMAYDDGAIPENPAAGLKVKAPKTVKLRDRDHSDEEAATILRATLGPQPAGLADHHALARRWVPWLCAYTGARVGEMTQLRAMDIQQEGDIWFILISPEADGGVKTNEARKVPLHSHLIEQGFTKLAKPGDTTPLFYRQGAGNEVNPGSKIRASDLAKWVRSLGVKTPQPNHGWRHRFKTITREVHIPEYVADKIQGHAPTTQSREYGNATLQVMKEAIEKLPAYVV